MHLADKTLASRLVVCQRAHCILSLYNVILPWFLLSSHWLITKCFSLIYVWPARRKENTKGKVFIRMRRKSSRNSLQVSCGFRNNIFFILMNINCINIFCQRYIIQTNENHRNILMVIPWRPLAKLNVQFKRDSILFLFYLNNMLFSNWWLFIVYKQTKCIKDGKTSQNHSRHFTRER